MRSSSQAHPSSIEEDDDQYSIRSSEHDYPDCSRRSSARSDRTDKTYLSQSTVPTEYEYITDNFAHMHYSNGREEDDHQSHAQCYYYSPRASVETYASTVPSIVEIQEEPIDAILPQYQHQTYYDDAIPTTPADFSALFPSSRKLSISHDDSTPDGNMNLKINTEIRTPRGRVQNMTLFHLRLYDLKSREFSLRRYDRDSGREVCHTVRKYQKTAREGTPGFQRSLSKALTSLRTRPEHRLTTLSTSSSHSSRSGSKKSFDTDESEQRPQSSGQDGRSHPQIPTNTTKLEFSNYAKVEVKRRGTKSNKRYEFEYWGIKYQWKRIVTMYGQEEQTAFHLCKSGSNDALARIVPEPLSPSQRREEQQKGGFVPPSAMWIDDEHLIRMQNDVSE